jgi:hypothetical protein
MDDRLASLIGTDERFGRIGYPRGGGIAKSGSPELRATALAGDIVRRLQAAVTDLRSRIDWARAGLEANETALRKIQTADLQRLSLANAPIWRA